MAGGLHSRPKAGKNVPLYDRKYWNFVGEYSTRSEASTAAKGRSNRRGNKVKKVKGRYIALERRRRGDIT